MDLTTPPGRKLTTADLVVSNFGDFGSPVDRMCSRNLRHVGCVDP